MKLANSQKVKNSWFRKFLKLTNAPRHLDFFPAAKVENFELERPMVELDLSKNPGIKSA